MKNCSKLVLFFAVIIVAIGIGVYYYLQKPETVSSSLKNTIEMPQEEAKTKVQKVETKEVANIHDLGDGPKIIYATRTITGFSEDKKNIYQTDFYLTDLEGKNKYKFYSANDLTYELVFPYGQDKILILKSLEKTANRVINFEGEEVKDLFFPDVYYGDEFLLSKDKNKIAYTEDLTDWESVSSDKTSEDLKMSLVVRDFKSQEETKFNFSDFKYNNFEMVRLVPQAFSPDNKIVYVWGTVIGQERSDPNGLFKVDLSSREIEPLYFITYETEDKDFLDLLGVYPEFGFALVNRGPLVSNNDLFQMRTQLQKLNLETKKFEDLLINETKDMIGAVRNILSPDGKKLILVNDAYHDKGLSLYDLETGEVNKLNNQGDFISWDPQGQNIIYQILKYSEDKNLTEGEIEVHVLNIETRNDYTIYTQEAIDEGTGLNEIGDVFYNYIGVVE